MNPFHFIGKLVPDDSDLGDLARRLFGLVAVSVFVGVIISMIFLVGAVSGEYQTRRGLPLVVPQVSAARVEYYRGVFDVCLANVPNKEWCVGLVQYAIDNNWYETESVDWFWSEYK